MANKPNPLQIQYDKLKKEFEDLTNENRLLKEYAVELQKEKQTLEEKIKELNKRIPKDLFG